VREPKFTYRLVPTDQRNEIRTLSCHARTEKLVLTSGTREKRAARLVVLLEQVFWVMGNVPPCIKIAAGRRDTL
jgi:hypothetical protein